MTSEAVTARADYSPTNNLSGDVFIQFKNENYTYRRTFTLSVPPPLRRFP